MTWIHVAVAIPAAFFAWTLIRDFLAGLGEDRLWGDPEQEETAVGARPEWEAISCRVYDFASPGASGGGRPHIPLDREA